MENTFEKILKDGERKGYFRVLNNGAKIKFCLICRNDFLH